MNDVELVTRFMISLGMGLLLGLERERAPETKAGVRTFALVAMLGSLCAMLAERSASAWLLPAGMAALAAMMIMAYRNIRPGDDPGTTTVVAVLLCFGLGALCWYGLTQIAVAIALATTSLLYFKAELHGVTRRLSRQDWVSLLQFAVVTFVVLPVLPDQGYGPYGALNPYRIWLMVVLVSGLNLGGYVLLRLTGEDRGLPAIGVLGGIVSSTATTLTYSRHAGARRISAAAAAVVVLSANLVVLAKLAVIVAVVSPALLPKALPLFAGGILAGIAVPWVAWRGLLNSPPMPRLEVSNPSEMRVAVGFAALYAVVLVIVAWLNDVAGSRGVYFGAVVSGLTDIDAIALSSLQLGKAGKLSPAQTLNTIALAYASSQALKLVIVGTIGGSALARKTALGYVCVLGGLVLGILAWSS